ncbi:hypothetical protein AB0T70_05770 [Acinetobacter baumannii]|uniref:hypothetical protein n=1 Tax=Acinetobacter baumannii TaxID=470 RepID=UPI000E091D98|nr:hypothetical protein [Acinetobacter baumannii]MBD0085228.1 hypothetical protein [Acinetobacter baumannii]MBD0153568.1 hypothetical protein [Acinetobacter baumannii]MBD0159174.1 hypothetical protein [Acinetobacter baumannii]MBD0164131.1 hypothetical protein [Acinetobacter baumannii]MDY1569451.1 hypothetical protein [Acinetobacter baumannii]
MTDLNKLRSEFEAYEHSKKPCAIKERLFKVFTKDELDEDEHAYIGKYVDSFMQEKWELWQKAKAQAVPEGYVLLPRVPTEKFKEDLKQHLDELWWGDHGCDWDGFVSVNGIDPLKIYALAIEASKSGAEG